MTFGARLAAAMDDHGPLCVGIDPHPGLLAAWGLADDVGGPAQLRAARGGGAGRAGRGAQAAVGVLRAARVGGRRPCWRRCWPRLSGRGSQVILDAKRGDIGSTMAGYADAYLRDGSPLAADALTVSPYLGPARSPRPLDAARAGGRGLFVLCLTSNPEGAAVQHARRPGQRRQRRVARWAAEANAEAADGGRLGSVGLVVGATVGDAVARLGLDLAAVRRAAARPRRRRAGGRRGRAGRGVRRRPSAVLASTSRAVLAAGPDLAALRAAADRRHRTRPRRRCADGSDGVRRAAGGALTGHGGFRCPMPVRVAEVGSTSLGSSRPPAPRRR